MKRQPLDTHLSQKPAGVRLARVYSNLFSPPSLFALFGFIFAWAEQPFWRGTLQAAAYGFLASLLPVLYIVALLKRGQVRDLHISDPVARRAPYRVGVAGALGAFLLVRAMGGGPMLLALILTNLIAMAGLTLFNQKWLVSAHMTGVMAIALLLVFTVGPLGGLAFLPLVGATFFVRLYLRRHTLPELLGGAAWGAAAVLGVAATGVLPGARFLI